MKNRILITGAAGFVGARVTRQLVEQGRDVALLLRPSSRTARIDDLLPRCTVIRGDLRQVEALSGALVDFAPETVLHLAWEGVKGSERNSEVHFQNVRSALDLYRLGESLGVKHFVGLGSQAEYGPAPGKLDELAPTRPTTVYGAAKLATCLLLERYAAATGQAFAWLRLFSSYGEDDDPSWLLQYLARTLLAGQRPAVTAAEQRWDYIHVDDVARAVVAVMDFGARGIFNLGSGQAHPLHEVISLLRDAIDPSLEIGFGEVPYRPDQVMHLEADITALRAGTGWQPRIGLREGLAQLVAWHRARPAAT
jgi:nucleoside-diphosphate-sugar epimerase